MAMFHATKWLRLKMDAKWLGPSELEALILSSPHPDPEFVYFHQLRTSFVGALLKVEGFIGITQIFDGDNYGIVVLANEAAFQNYLEVCQEHKTYMEARRGFYQKIGGDLVECGIFQRPTSEVKGATFRLSGLNEGLGWARVAVAGDSISIPDVSILTLGKEKFAPFIKSGYLHTCLSLVEELRHAR